MDILPCVPAVFYCFLPESDTLFESLIRKLTDYHLQSREPGDCPAMLFVVVKNRGGKETPLQSRRMGRGVYIIRW